jgi:hypothetical protein
MPTKRAIYSIQAEVLARFNTLFKGHERSRAVEHFMIEAIKEREDEIVAAAKLIEKDPAFSEYHEVSKWADAQAIDTLVRS